MTGVVCLCLRFPVHVGLHICGQAYIYDLFKLLKNVAGLKACQCADDVSAT